MAKNRIEFQWGSKLPGTSSEALVNVCELYHTYLLTCILYFCKYMGVGVKVHMHLGLMHMWLNIM